MDGFKENASKVQKVVASATAVSRLLTGSSEDYEEQARLESLRRQYSSYEQKVEQTTSETKTK